MELPIYYSFKDFTKNWENDYKKYSKVFQNCTKKQFLNEIKTTYLTNYFDGWDLLIKGFPYSYKDDYFVCYDGDEINTGAQINGVISFTDFENYFSMYLNKYSDDDDILIEDKYFRITLLETQIFIVYDFEEYCLEVDDLKKYEPFFEFKDNQFSFNHQKFTDFEYSIPQIFEVIENETNPKPQNSNVPTTEINEIPENDFSDNEEKIKLKVEMIILKEFGIIDLLTKTQNLTNSETAKRICIILSDKIEKSGLKEPQKYIENILTAIGRGNPDVSSDKTPYKKQNIKDALSELTKRGLSIENTTYLKNLKQTHSNLFD